MYICCFRDFSNLHTENSLLCYIVLWVLTSTRQNSFITNNFSITVFVVNAFPQSQSLETTDLFSALLVLCFPEGHMNGTMQYVNLLVWPLSLGKMHLRFIHVVMWIKNLFLFIVLHCMQASPFFIHSGTGRYVKFFQFWQLWINLQYWFCVSININFCTVHT